MLLKNLKTFFREGYQLAPEMLKSEEENVAAELRLGRVRRGTWGVKGKEMLALRVI